MTKTQPTEVASIGKLDSVVPEHEPGSVMNRIIPGRVGTMTSGTGQSSVISDFVSQKIFRSDFSKFNIILKLIIFTQ